MVAVVLALPVAAHGAAGDLDPTFGNEELVQTLVGTDVLPLAMIQQPDGKLVVGGSAIVSGDQDWALVRYNADGTLDDGFGEGGIVTFPVGNGADLIFGLALGPGNTILAGGAAAIGVEGRAAAGALWVRTVECLGGAHGAGV